MIIIKIDIINIPFTRFEFRLPSFPIKLQICKYLSLVSVMDDSPTLIKLVILLNERILMF